MHLALACLLVALVSAPGHPAEQRSDPRDSWSPQERWAWGEIVEGRAANFNKRYGAMPAPAGDDAEWTRTDRPRRLRAAFVTDVLTIPSLTAQVPPSGLRVVGGWFPDPIALTGIGFSKPLWFDRSRFDSPVQFDDVSLGVVSFDGSHFAREVEISGSLGEVATFRGITSHAPFILRYARIAGQLTISGSLAKETNLNGVRVGNSLQLGDGAADAPQSLFEGKVIAIGASIEGQFSVDNATVSGGLDMEGSRTRMTMFVTHADVSVIDLTAASLHDVNMQGSEVALLELDGAVTKGSVIVRTSSLHEVNAVYAKVGKNLEISDSNIMGEADFTGATIARELRLGNQGRFPPRWGESGRLNLRNVEINALQDCVSSDGAAADGWPRAGQLELAGFEYHRLGGLNSTDEMSARDVRLYIDWLELDRTYSPQPYHHLASAFRTMGAVENADAVLYAARERERAEAGFAKWIGLSLLKVTIGYGLGAGYFRALYWVLGLALVGTMVLETVPATSARGLPWCAWASVDEILPIVELDESHAKTINAALTGWKLYYFYCHRIMAYVLGSFVVAGLSGLTQGG